MIRYISVLIITSVLFACGGNSQPDPIVVLINNDDQQTSETDSDNANSDNATIPTTTADATPSSQWENTTWSCVSNVPEITAQWQLQLNADRTVTNLARGESDPLRTGVWEDRGNDGFTVSWPDGRSTEYQTLGNGFIDDSGSRCHQEFYPARTPDPQPLALQGTWSCSAYIPNGYNYTLQIGADGFTNQDQDAGLVWTISNDGRLATTDQSNPAQGYHQCSYVDAVGPTVTLPDGSTVTGINWPHEDLSGKTVACNSWYFIDGIWQQGNGRTLGGYERTYTFNSDGTGRFNTFSMSTNGIYTWSRNPNNEYRIIFTDGAGDFIHELTKEDVSVWKRGNVWQILPEAGGEYSSGTGCSIR